MDNYQSFDTIPLNNVGLNRQAVFDLGALPDEVIAPIRASCALLPRYRQLILIGHAGRTLWESVMASGIASEDPIDDFSTQSMRQWFAQYHPSNAYEILYPGTHMIGLQQLGQLAGWHHASPFMVGIDKTWGSWYAYRAVIVADTNFKPTMPVSSDHPCHGCEPKVCVTSCPAGAMDQGQFDLGKCIGHRKQEGARCKSTCVARVSCPVGSEHRYCDAQIRHTYLGSMRAIERYY